MRLGQAVKYRSAGTVEFVFDADARRVLFPRGQHAAAGRARRHRGGHRHRPGRVDGAAGRGRARAADGSRSDRAGRAIQVRLYAEDPGKNFQPSAGVLTDVAFPTTRASTPGSSAGTEVTPFYDPLLAKIIVQGADARRGDRAAAARRWPRRESPASRPTSSTCGRSSPAPAFARGGVTTGFLDGARVRRRAPSRCSTAARRPRCRTARARSATGHVGVPPSGPMDDAVVPPRQSPAGQRRRRGRARDDASTGPDAALRLATRSSR